MASGSCGKWWMARTNLEKTLLLFSIILLLTFIINILVGVVRPGEKTAEPLERKVCSSHSCLEKVGSMISMMDFSVDPCDDFYEFSCGQYVKKHSMPMDYWEASVEHDAIDAVKLQLKDWLQSSSGNNISVYVKAKTLFNTCLESSESAKDPVHLLEKAMEQQNMGHWAILDESWQGSYVGLEHSLAALSLLGIPVVFQMEVVPDDRNPGKFITKLSPGKPSLHTEFQSMGDDLLSQFVETTLLLLGVQKDLVSSKVNEILSTEAKLINLRERANEECSNSSNPFARDLHTIRIENAQEMDDQMYSNVDWSDLLSQIFSVLNNNATKEFNLYLSCKRHMREFNDYFYHSDEKSANIYFGWRFFYSVMEYLSPSFRQLQSYYKQQLSGDNVLHYPRWKECLNLVEEFMLPVVARAYAEQAISESLLKEKVKMAEAVRTKWISLLTSAKWLPDTEKEWLKQKVKESKFVVAISKMLPDIEKLEEMFADLSLENDHCLYNVLRYRRFRVLQELRPLISPEQRPLEWDYKSLTSTDELHRLGDDIAVYYDKLRPPYLSLDQPKYMNYGAFGTFLSRQLNLYLISLGVLPKGSNDTLWSLFLRHHIGSECKTTVTDLASDDKISTEDWIDLFGEITAIKVAYESYTDLKDDDDLLPGIDLTKEQLFFLSYAQTKCEIEQKRSGNNKSKVPARMSVNFALRNFEGFGSAFSCQKDAGAKHCQVWN